MNQSIEDRMDSIEQQLKELRKEMEESVARYKQREYLFVDGDIRDFPKITYDFPEFKLWEMEEKCLRDNIPVEDHMKPRELSCSCRKCSTYQEE